MFCLSFFRFTPKNRNQPTLLRIIDFNRNIQRIRSIHPLPTRQSLIYSQLYIFFCKMKGPYLEKKDEDKIGSTGSVFLTRATHDSKKRERS